MSRSALNFAMKRQLASGIVPGADPFAILEPWQPDEERVSNAAYEMHGNTRTFNMEAILAQNIVVSNYFQRELLEWPDAADLVGEARERVTHVEPYAPGGAHAPSPAFCILYRLMVTRLTAKELNILLLRSPEPLLRAMGLLYLRYTCPPALLWDWFVDALEDDTTTLSPGINAASSQTTIAAFARSLLGEPRYYNSQLPPLPVKLRQEMTVKLLLADKDRTRRAANAKRVSADPSLLAPGAAVRARYADDEKWYDAAVDGEDESSPCVDVNSGKLIDASDADAAAAAASRGKPQIDPRLVGLAAAAAAAPSATSAKGRGGSGLVRSRYWVTYAGFGNSESVPLGRIDLPLPTAVASASSSSASQPMVDSGRVSGGREYSRARSRSRSRGVGGGGGGGRPPQQQRRDDYPARDGSRGREHREEGDDDYDRQRRSDPERARGGDEHYSRDPRGGSSRSGALDYNNSSNSVRPSGSDRDYRDRGPYRDYRDRRCGDHDTEYRGRGDRDTEYRRSRSPRQRSRSRSRSSSRSRSRSYRERPPAASNAGIGRGGRYYDDDVTSAAGRGGAGRRSDYDRDYDRRDRSLSYGRGAPSTATTTAAAAGPVFAEENDSVEALRRQVADAARAHATVAPGSRDYAPGGRPAGVSSSLATRGGDHSSSSSSSSSGGGGGASRRSDYGAPSSSSLAAPSSSSRHGDPSQQHPHQDATSGPSSSSSSALSTASASNEGGAGVPPAPPPSAAALARAAELQSRYGSSSSGGGGPASSSFSSSSSSGGGPASLRTGSARDGDEDEIHLPSAWKNS